MKNLIVLLILLSLSVLLKAQVSPAPVAGTNTIVSAGGWTYMVNYAKNMPPGAKLKMLVLDMGLGEDTDIEVDDKYGWLYLTRLNQWDMRIVRAPGDTIYFALLGRPHRGYEMPRYAPGTDAICNWFVQQGLLDSTDDNNFINMTVSKGGPTGWYYMTNYLTHNSLYFQKFNKRTLTMSTMSTTSQVNNYSKNGRHAVAFASDDGNIQYTPPSVSYAHYNKIHSSSLKRIDSLAVGGHSPTTWNYFMKATNFNLPAGPTTHNAQTHILDWLIDPNMGVGTPNAAPTANAGANQSIVYPTTSVTLSGSGADSDGTIAAYQWTKVSGGKATITSPNSATTTVTGLEAGSYLFRLRVTDNGGAIAYDDMEVNMTGGNIPPVVNPIADKAVGLPSTTTTLTAVANDDDGTIVSYAWTKVSGPAGGTISSPSSATTNITGLQIGTYTYRITVTDNSGETAFTEVDVVVTSSSIIVVRGRRAVIN